MIGFFPKITELAPTELGAEHVIDVCSVSTHISDGPSGWMENWQHNRYGLFAREDLALSMVNRSEDLAVWDLYAFKLFPITAIEGKIVNCVVKGKVFQAIPSDYGFLGFDVANRTGDDGAFECSPLSCNYFASSMTCNKHCLFDTLEDSISAAKEFSISTHGHEPGPYYVVEVHRAKAFDVAVRCGIKPDG